MRGVLTAPAAGRGGTPRLSLLAVVLAAGGLARGGPLHAGPPAVPDAAAKDAAASADAREQLRRLEKLGFAGVVVVARDGRPLLAEGYGLADREKGTRWTPATVSSIGSITKQFTAAAVLSLEEEGRLRVEEPMARYLPDVPAAYAGVTIHQLLSHSSGVVDPDGLGDFDPIGREEYVRRALARPPAYPPGQGFEYANANYSLLGAIVERVSGKGYEAFLRDRLLLRTGMYETGILLPAWGAGRLAQGYDRKGTPRGTVLGRPMADDGPFWALRANGGIHSTAYDMLRWAEALRSGRVLGAASVKKLWTPHAKEGDDSDHGYGWSVRTASGVTLVEHNGSDGIFYAHLVLVPGTGLVLFLMTNVLAEVPASRDLAGEIAARVELGTPLPEVPDVVPADRALLARAAGTYALAGDPVSATVSGETLLLEAGGRSAFTLLHSSEPMPAGRAGRLDRQMERLLAANQAGDFRPLAQAYGGRVPVATLREHWQEAIAAVETEHGKLATVEVLGTARTANGDETVVRLSCERGAAFRTYAWDPGHPGRLRGASDRGLAVKLAFVPTGPASFASWDGGVRPSRTLRLDVDEAGRVRLTLAGTTVLTRR